MTINVEKQTVYFSLSYVIVVQDIFYPEKLMVDL